MMKKILNSIFAILIAPAIALSQPHGSAIQATKITDGTDTVTVASALDSRNGIHTAASSVETKSLVDFHSDSGGLAGGGTKVFSPGGTRATYYDTAGYGLLNINFTDNSSGAGGGTLYIRWSRDGINTPFNDPGDGTGLTNYTTGVNTTTDGLVVVGRLLPLAARYVNFVYVNNGTAQGTTYPQLAEVRVDLAPIGFSTGVSVTNQSLPVYGITDFATGAAQPVIVGGVNSISAPTIANGLVVNSSGAALVAQGSTATASNSGWKVEGEIAHDSVDASTNNPIMLGGRGIAHGTTPTAVTANDVTRWYFNREGVPWVIGGAPNLITIRANYTTAQTDTALVTVAAGTKIIVTSCSVTNSNATTVNVAARIGLGATTTPTATGCVTHPGLAPGSGIVMGTGAGQICQGADGEDLRITSGVPTTGSIDVLCSYYTSSS